MPVISRRGLFALGAAGLFVPRRLLAAPSTGERKFLFLFCQGGWDTCLAFAPVFNDHTDHGSTDTAATAGGIDFVDAENRPSVRSFFENWGSRSCLINGLQIPSVAHDVCRLWTMTGSARGAEDDWVSIIAGHTAEDRILPNIHISGPIYPHVYSSASVRVGLTGQLPSLVDGTALDRASVTIDKPAPERDALEEAFVRARLDAWAAGAPDGLPARMAAAEQLAMDRSARLPAVADALTVSDRSDLYATASVAVRALANGLSRTAMVGYGIGGNGTWDTHSGNDLQQLLFEELFSVLDLVLTDLAAAPGEASASLLDETTVVVLSEMGRTPELNGAGGKDHWTWTSALLVGSGVAGGRTVGAWTEDLTGEPVDLATGEPSDDGVTMVPGHLGATLLALADIDPGPFVPEEAGDVIEGVLE